MASQDYFFQYKLSQSSFYLSLTLKTDALKTKIKRGENEGCQIILFVFSLGNSLTVRVFE